MFKHYLLCRYNLGLYSSNPYNIENFEAWESERVKMFRRLLNSLKNQTNKNFILLVAVDSNCPEDVKRNILAQLKESLLHCILITEQPMHYLQRIKINEPWLITSRIDNDDEYRERFIETIQKNFKQKEEILDVKGWQSDGEKYYTSGRETPNSPFITLIEKSKNPKTAQFKPHTQMSRIFESRFASNEILYIQHVHESNAMNKIIGKPIKLKTVVGIATFKGREKSLQKVVELLTPQVDEIIIYNNEINQDLTDNGKFYGLTIQKEPCYYFTCDDDLHYPSDYIQNLKEGIERTGGIVTHHGRKLIGLDRSYYRGHKSYRCLDENTTETIIDVCGTGVTGFRTDYFNPIGLHKAQDKKMSDLVFSLEATKQGKKITVLKHSGGWITHLPIDHSKSIHTTESRREKRQIEIANEIFKIKTLRS